MFILILLTGSRALGEQSTIHKPALSITSTKKIPDVVAKAKQRFSAFQSGNVDCTPLGDVVNPQLFDVALRVESATLKALCRPESFHFARRYMIGKAMGYDFIVKFRNARIVEMIALSPDGKIIGI